MLVITNASEILLLKYILNYTAASNVVLRLYKNDVVPSETDNISTYAESTESGYSAITLTGTNWSFNTVSGSTTATYAQQTFTFLVGATVYGYYVTNNVGTALLWAERFEAPEVVGSLGGVIRITPVLGGE
jgi:hypothetical protein